MSGKRPSILEVVLGLVYTTVANKAFLITIVFAATTACYQWMHGRKAFGDAMTVLAIGTVLSFAYGMYTLSRKCVVGDEIVDLDDNSLTARTMRTVSDYNALKARYARRRDEKSFDELEAFVVRNPWLLEVGEDLSPPVADVDTVLRNSLTVKGFLK